MMLVLISVIVIRWKIISDVSFNKSISMLAA